MVGRDIADLFTRDSWSSGETLLEVNGLTTAEVSDVSLSVRKGEVVGIAGLMGAGRSELAKAIVGYDQPPQRHGFHERRRGQGGQPASGDRRRHRLRARGPQARSAPPVSQHPR